MQNRLANNSVKPLERVRQPFKAIPVAKAVGTVLAHDLTRILPGEFKGRAFKRGHIVREEDVPALLDNVTWDLGGVSLSSLQVIIIFLSLGLMLVLDHVVHRTPVGMAMRAISWDRTFVPLMGVPVNTIISVTFAIGAGLAG